jgi:transposase
MARAHDDKLLEMVQLRHAGMSTGEIAKRFGATKSNVGRMTNEVRDADIALCGEKVRGAYW